MPTSTSPTRSSLSVASSGRPGPPTAGTPDPHDDHDQHINPRDLLTGRIPDADLIRVLSTADVCLAPDPHNPLNDVSSMNKIVEYMAMGRAIVSFDLREARFTA